MLIRESIMLIDEASFYALEAGVSADFLKSVYEVLSTKRRKLDLGMPLRRYKTKSPTLR
jgi:hypothetical protein